MDEESQLLTQECFAALGQHKLISSLIQRLSSDRDPSTPLVSSLSSGCKLLSQVFLLLLKFQSQLLP
jgi:hypothetical protein